VIAEPTPAREAHPIAAERETAEDAGGGKLRIVTLKPRPR
jgi:hypothetical protein